MCILKKKKKKKEMLFLHPSVFYVVILTGFIVFHCTENYNFFNQAIIYLQLSHKVYNKLHWFLNLCKYPHFID